MRAAPGRSLHRLAFQLSVATISWNVAEAVVALSLGLPANSVALTGFGLDSLIEVTSAFLVFWKLSGSPHDGIRREEAARRGISLTFLLLALWILGESTGSLRSGQHPEQSRAGIVLAFISLCLMPILGFAKMRTGKRLKSRAIQADAVETFVCAWLSASLLAGLGLHTAFGWWWADAMGALFMVPFLLWQAWETWSAGE